MTAMRQSSTHQEKKRINSKIKKEVMQILTSEYTRTVGCSLKK